MCGSEVTKKLNSWKVLEGRVCLSLWFDMTTTRTDIGKARKKVFAKTNNELLISPTEAALEECVKGQPTRG